MDDKIIGLLVKPDKLPEKIEFKNNLETLQHYVGGYIECAYPQIEDGVVFVCNDEGKINGMQLNRDIGYDIIAGPFLVLGDDYINADFKSLTEEQIEKYQNVFDKNSIKKTKQKIIEILTNKNKNKDYER